jgi:hypothetical protein
MGNVILNGHNVIIATIFFIVGAVIFSSSSGKSVFNLRRCNFNQVWVHIRPLVRCVVNLLRGPQIKITLKLRQVIAIVIAIAIVTVYSTKMMRGLFCMCAAWDQACV